MLYEKYERRVRRKVSIFRQIYKYRILLITLASIAFFSMSAYSVSKGTVYNVSIPDSFVYSEQVNFSSDALFSTVSYSYRIKGETTWLDEMPTIAGEYEVQIQSKQMFGRTKSQIKDFTINPKNIVLNLEESTIVFGDNPVFKADLAQNDYIDDAQFTFDDISQSTTRLNLQSIIIRNSAGVDVTSSYRYETVELPINFTARPITVTLLDISAIYDGNILRSDEIEITKGSLVEGHLIEVSSLGEQLSVGNSLNTILTSHVSIQGIDVTSNYQIVYQDGSLEVTPNPITIETLDKEKIYDGNPLSNRNYELIEGSLIEGHSIEVVDQTSLSSVGKIDNVLSIKIVDSNGIEVTSNYTISYNYGQLQVRTRPITITSNSESKIYDGISLSNTVEFISNGSLVSGHTTNVVTETNIVNVGIADNIISVEIRDAEGNNVNSNYAITYVTGQLEITARPITIQTDSDIKVYDATPLQQTTNTITQGELIVGHTRTITTQTTITNVGEVDNVLAIDIMDAQNTNVTSNYEITYIFGTLEITKKAITIKAQDASKVYDGMILTSNIPEIVVGNIINGQSITITTIGWQKDVGSSLNSINTAVITENLIDLSSNYEITFEDAILEVTKRLITIKTEDVTKVYDGTVLISNIAEVTTGTLVSGHTVEVTSIGSQLNAGTSLNTIVTANIYEAGIDVTNNYDISTQNGQLEITTRPITVTPINASKVYDGVELISNTVEVSGVYDLVEGHNITATTIGSQTNVASSLNMVSSVIILEGTTNVTANYDVSYLTGLLEVTPRPITIKAEFASKVYDGITLTHDEVEIISGSLIGSHIITITTSGNQTNVGNSLNPIETAVITNLGNDLTYNYDITYEDGVLEVTPRPITIKAENATKMYDGISLNSNIVEFLSGTLLAGHTIEISTSGSQLDVGSSLNSISNATIYNDGIDITSNYQVNYQDGSLEVTSRPILLAPLAISKIYDGMEFTSNIIEILGIYDIVDGQNIVAITSGSQLHVGSSVNTILSLSIYNNGTDVTGNYDITYNESTLTVTPRPIIMKAIDIISVYDGIALTSNLVEFTGIYSLVGGQTLTVTTSGSQTNVGSSTNTIISSVIMDDETDVTSDYDITYQNGLLEITPRPISIESISDSKVYDGTALSNSSYVITEGSLANGQIIEVITHTENTNVSIVDNILGFVIKAPIEIDVSSNYEISYIYGQLEITPREITIVSESDSKIYNGTILSNMNYTIIDGSLVLGHTIEVIDHTESTNVGIVDNVLNIEVKDSGDANVSSNYQINYLYGQLEVTPREITISSDNDSQVYDGTALSNINYTITEGSVASGQTIEVVYYTESTNVSIVDNILIIDIKDSENTNVSSNYDITYLHGKLEITPVSITIITASESKIYDGTALLNQNYTVSTGSLILGDVINVSSHTDIEDVGVIDNVLTIDIFNSSNMNITNNYDITIEFGLLEVTQRPVLLAAKDASKVYDGIALTSTEVESIGLLDIVTGQDIIASTTGSQTNVGTSINTINSIQIFKEGIDVTSNYSISVQDGTLEVTPRPITIQSGDASKEYDGTPLENLNYEITVGSFVDGHSININSNTSLTTVDVVDNILGIEILNESNESTISNYEITYNNGFLEVLPRIIVVSTSSATKDYDGSPLTNDQWEVTSGSLIDGHQLNITVTGTITEVGKEFNTFDYEILDASLNDVTMYYTLVENIGILEVERVKVLLVIETASDSKIYDGLPLTKEEWILSDGELLPNHTLEIVFTGEITEVGTADNTFTYTILDEFLTDVTNDYYFVQETLGTLSIFSSDENGSNSADSSPISSEGDLDSLYDSTGIVLEVYSEINDTIYLRDKSYGDYIKSGWATPLVYVSPYGLSPLQFPALAINNTINSYEIEIKAIQSGLSYYLPYYSINGFYDNSNDIYASHSYGLSYSMDYVSINTVNYENLSIENPLYSGYELEYRDFVYDNYLQLPNETKAALLDIASANGLNAESSTVITDVQSYIQNAAVYNLAYKPIPDNVDNALYFLTVSHEGICQHFATAGVVMYRALGIPARYVTGYVAYSTANEWIEVSNKQAHAWVEIYIDGFGWIPLEVTGSGAIDGSGSGTNPGTPTDEEEAVENTDNLKEITIISGNASKHYDGLSLSKDSFYYTGVLETGHTLHVDITATITMVGETDNVFTYTILDENGIDVSDSYFVQTRYGSLVVVANNEQEIFEFQVYDISKAYNGDFIEHASNEYWMPSHNLPDGYTVVFDILGEIKDVGKITTYIDQSTIRILDENLMDVTNNYNIVTYKGSIEVIERNITITSFSARKDYDGQPLTSDVYYISQGVLAEGDTITLDITGSITEVGETSNSITSILITNTSGDDVSDNYNITIVEGILIVDEG